MRERTLTIGLIAFAVYFAVVTVRDAGRRPRTFYAQPDPATLDWWA
jgi:hypothetical protein